MSGRKKWLAIGVFLVAVISVWGFRHRGKTEVLERDFVTRPVLLGDLERKVTATGRIKAMKTVHVGAQVSGIITDVRAEFNSRVHRGDVLAQIDPAIYRAQVLEARSNLKKIRTQIVLDRLALKRDRDLLEKHIIAQNVFDQDQGKLSMDKANEDELVAGLALANANLRYTTIRAPIDGIVISRQVQVGQTVTAAFKTPRLFTIAQDLSEMRLDTRVSESDIGDVREGQRVTFRVPAYPDRVFSGQVIMVRVHPKTVSHVVTYDVVSRVSNPDLSLKPGMTALVTLHVGTLRHVLLIPNGAMVFRPSERFLKSIDMAAYRHKTLVFKIEDNRIVPVPIVAGATDGRMSVALSGALRPGDRVIVRDRLGQDRKSHGGFM
ncbi:MAG: efflux RND transporter periplasmic adaptor subunit [Nitrospirae bacterium]|nr:efflux RND transporter periplasmic adaptor subunit [Nitrospirota bacterium]